MAAFQLFYDSYFRTSIFWRKIMFDHEKRQMIEYGHIHRELNNAEGAGIVLMLNGAWSGPSEIARACVFEEETEYLRRYIKGPDGETQSIDFYRKD